MLRSDARELAVHLLYSAEFTGDTPEEEIDLRLEPDYYKKLAAENPVYTERPSKKQMSYLDTVVSGVMNRKEELNGIIAAYSVGWDVKRISRLTRTTMQLAIFEAKYMEDIPTGVAIAEAIRIIKKYDEEAAGFANGILGSFARSMASAEPAEAAQTQAESDEAEQ